MAKNLAQRARFFLKNKKGGKMKEKRNVCILRDRCIFGDNCPGTMEDLKSCAPILKKAGKGVCKYCGAFGDLFELNKEYKVCISCFKNLIEFELLRSKELSFSEIKNIIERMRPQEDKKIK